MMKVFISWIKNTNTKYKSITKYYRVLQSITEYAEYYRVFLAHLLGIIFGLVIFEDEAGDEFYLENIAQEILLFFD